MMRGMVVNPLTGDVVACVSGATASDLDDAFEAVEFAVDLMFAWADFVPGVTHVTLGGHAAYPDDVDIDSVDAAYLALSIPAACQHPHETVARIGWGEDVRVAWRCVACDRVVEQDL